MTDSADSQVSRTPTAVDAFAETYFARQLELDPIMATLNGIAGHDARMPDLSPDGHAARAGLVAETLAGLDELTPDDDVDRVTIAAMAERLTVTSELDAVGAPLSELNNIHSPVQSLRDVFDLMPAGTADDWATTATRLGALPAAIDGYVDSLRLAASRGDIAPQRQIAAGITQSENNIGPDGFFAGLAAGASAGGVEIPDSLQADLDRASHASQAGYQKLRDYLADELMRQAPIEDAVGRERYELASRKFLGARVDLEEAYVWGQDELARITRLMDETANEIKTGASVGEAIALLDSDPGRRLTGKPALRAWMQEQSDAAIEALSDSHFDIPEPVRRLECRIAPTTTGVIYYTHPSDDFVRPGRMWWSVPDGVTEFSTWRELTTVYHEGVPGHHLQVGQTTYRRELLNDWRRLGAWVSGHGEGWALYAEWLMADLGYLDDPGNRLGLLDGQAVRAVRVIIDIGVHCGFTAPREVGGGAWTYEKAWQLMNDHTQLAREVKRFELERYLGWPGQAPSYKLGERLWLQLRDESRARAGSAFDLKAFHRRALDIGSVGLDVLRPAVLGEL